MRNDPLVRGEFIEDGKVLLAVALHHLQVLDVGLQLGGLPARRLGLGRHLASANGTCARTDLEGATGRDALVAAQHAQGSRRLQPRQRECEP
ncbi:hypothetical protein ACWGDT_21030 [Streptomyces avermitilis]